MLCSKPHWLAGHLWFASDDNNRLNNHHNIRDFVLSANAQLVVLRCGYNQGKTSTVGQDRACAQWYFVLAMRASCANNDISNKTADEDLIINHYWATQSMSHFLGSTSRSVFGCALLLLPWTTVRSITCWYRPCIPVRVGSTLSCTMAGVAHGIGQLVFTDNLPASVGNAISPIKPKISHISNWPQSLGVSISKLHHKSPGLRFKVYMLGHDNISRIARSWQLSQLSDSL